MPPPPTTTTILTTLTTTRGNKNRQLHICAIFINTVEAWFQNKQESPSMNFLMDAFSVPNTMAKVRIVFNIYAVDYDLLVLLIDLTL
jgi:hypothetical protein